jgi:aminoglycoside 6'-N-acetyltransferase
MGELRLSGSRVVLRPIVEADLEPLLQILLEPEIAQWWHDYDAERLRADTLDDACTTSLAVELPNGEIIGIVMFTEELDPYYRSAGLDITLATSCLGQGLGPDALRAVATYLFRERGHHRLTIDPAVINTRAIAAYVKIGFRPVGVLRSYELGPGGQWRDALLMDMLEGELT